MITNEVVNKSEFAYDQLEKNDNLQRTQARIYGQRKATV
jgi:hypothetical protein